MACPVKNFNSSMAGAPVLNGTAGSLIAVLDACLVNGFNLITLDALSVSGNVLTGTKAGHGFVVGQIVSTTANEQALNADWAITEVTSNTFSAAAAGIVNISGTGTLTAKTTAAGWSKMFSGTNRGAYKSIYPSSTGMFLRVDDAGEKTARVVGYETMSDIDTGSGAFPSNSKIAGGGYWGKSNYADAYARPWMLFADAAGIYYVVLTSNDASCWGAFGDFPSAKPGDAYACLLSCKQEPAWTDYWGMAGLGQQNFSVSNDNRLFAPRSYTQLGSSVELASGFIGFGNIQSGHQNGWTYPSGPANGLIITQIALTEWGTRDMRSRAVPGLYATPQALPLTHGDRVSDVEGLLGRQLVAIKVPANNSEGRVFIDITGPWR